jgi:DinB superfamily
VRPYRPTALQLAVGNYIQLLHYKNSLCLCGGTRTLCGEVFSEEEQPMKRNEKIELFGKAYDLLIEALPKYPREMWQFKPSPKDWSIHQIIVHITDSEANSFVRCRRLIAEPGSAVLGYDQDVWVDNLDYHSQSPEENLELFKWLRLLSYKLIKNIPEKAWSHTIEHSENGTMTFDDWLQVYAFHIPDHLKQMDEVYAAWQTTTVL